jgi:effector-binding domain-containing protein
MASAWSVRPSATQDEAERDLCPGVIMHDAVTERTVAIRPTLVVATRSTWSEFPTRWRPLLDEVWGCLRAAGVTGGCPNVMLYLDDVPHVEVGVLMADHIPLTGRVVRSALPAGTIAATWHRGPYSGLREAHDAVHRWCTDRGHRLAGPRWEVYGPHRSDPADAAVEVCYLLA